MAGGRKAKSSSARESVGQSKAECKSKEKGSGSETVEIEVERTLEQTLAAVETTQPAVERAVQPADSADVPDTEEEEEDPFVKVAYKKGRLTGTRTRQSFERERREAVETCIEHLSREEDRIVGQERLRALLEDAYALALRKSKKVDPNKKRSLARGAMMMELLAEKLESDDWTIIDKNTPFLSPKQRERIKHSVGASGAEVVCECRSRVEELETAVAMGRLCVERLTARVKELEARWARKEEEEHVEEQEEVGFRDRRQREGWVAQTQSAARPAVSREAVAKSSAQSAVTPVVSKKQEQVRPQEHQEQQRQPQQFQQQQQQQQNQQHQQWQKQQQKQEEQQQEKNQPQQTKQQLQQLRAGT